MAWDPALKQRALELAEADGVAHAHRETGIPKATIVRWCKLAGVDVEVPAQVRAAAAVSRTDAVIRQADRFESYLEQIQTKAGRLVETVVGVNADYARAVARMDTALIEETANHVTGDTFVTFRDPEVESLRLRVKALKELSVEMPHAIGAFTRATHDLQLLQGKATENQAVQVVFSAGLAGPSAAEVAALDEGAVIVEGEVLE